MYVCSSWSVTNSPTTPTVLRPRNFGSIETSLDTNSTVYQDITKCAVNSISHHKRGDFLVGR